MGESQLHSVRRFNRLVTQRVGALEVDYLRRARPLAEARLIFEISAEGPDVRALRCKLGLDSGYLSRLLSQGFSGQARPKCRLTEKRTVSARLSLRSDLSIGKTTYLLTVQKQKIENLVKSVAMNVCNGSKRPNGLLPLGTLTFFRVVGGRRVIAQRRGRVGSSDPRAGKQSSQH